MHKRTKIWNCSFTIMVVFLMLSSCSKKIDENNNPTPGTVTDIDGNVYKTVTIGKQVWMTENLKTTKYNDGTPIPLVTNDTAWSDLITPGFCWYNNDSATYKNTYGALYNWYAVNTGKLAPIAWHIPTDAEWTIFTTFLGGEVTAGGKMKSIGTIETGTGLWYSPNTGATNESGFKAIPAGCREYFGVFKYIGSIGFYWSSSDSTIENALSRSLFYDYNDVYRSDAYKFAGFSVRCVRD